MELFPFFSDVEGKTCLIVGGGSVAKEKLARLMQFSMRFTVVAEQTDIQEAARLRVLKRPFTDADLDGADIVICATNDRTLNCRISDLCRQKNKPVNVVDDAALCSFIMPSIIKRGDLTVAISTAGKSPALAAEIRRSVEEILPKHTEQILERMGALRSLLPSVLPTQAQRREFYREILQKLMETDNALSDEEILEAARKAAETP